jgi:hypothetical protein
MLTTSCNGCLFLDNDGVCQKGQTNKDKKISGFCRLKRQGEAKEGENVAVIIICDEFLKAVEDTYKDTFAKLKNAAQVIFIGTNLQNDASKRLVKFCRDLKHAWIVDNYFRNKEEVTTHSIIEKAFLHINSQCNWFYVINASETIDQKVADSINGLLNGNTNGFAAIYHDRSNDYSMLINKFAFDEMEGHLDAAWIEKVKCFDNFGEVCIKV